MRNVKYNDFTGQAVYQYTFPEFDNALVLAKSTPEAQYELACAQLCDLFKLGVISNDAELIKAWEDIFYMVRYAEHRVKELKPAEAKILPMPESGKAVCMRTMLLSGLGG